MERIACSMSFWCHNRCFEILLAAIRMSQDQGFLSQAVRLAVRSACAMLSHLEGKTAQPPRVSLFFTHAVPRLNGSHSSVCVCVFDASSDKLPSKLSAIPVRGNYLSKQESKENGLDKDHGEGRQDVPHLIVPSLFRLCVFMFALEVQGEVGLRPHLSEAMSFFFWGGEGFDSLFLRTGFLSAGGPNCRLEIVQEVELIEWACVELVVRKFGGDIANQNLATLLAVLYSLNLVYEWANLLTLQ